jgi:hypothetical protein
VQLIDYNGAYALYHLMLAGLCPLPALLGELNHLVDQLIGLLDRAQYHAGLLAHLAPYTPMIIDSRPYSCGSGCSAG